MSVLEKQCAAPVAKLTPMASLGLDRVTRTERVKGAVFGMAVCDGIGLLTEFCSRDEAEAIIDAATSDAQRLTQKSRSEKAVLRAMTDEQYHRVTRFYKDRAGNPIQGGVVTDDTDQAVMAVRAIRSSATLEAAQKEFAWALLEWAGMIEGTPAGLPGADRSMCGLGDLVCGVIGYREFHRYRPDIQPAQRYLAHPFERAFQIWKQDEDKRGATYRNMANGALMRNGMIPALFDDLDKAVEASVMMAETTHADPRAAAACVAHTVVIHGLLHGNFDIIQLIENGVSIAIKKMAELVLQRQRAGAYCHILKEDLLIVRQFKEGSDTGLTLGAPWGDKISMLSHAYQAQLKHFCLGIQTWDALALADSPIGVVTKSLGAAIFGLRQLVTLMNHGVKPQDAVYSVMHAIARQGGDADTNGAVFGALAGAVVGYNNIPQDWCDALNPADKSVLERTAIQIYE